MTWSFDAPPHVFPAVSLFPGNHITYLPDEHTLGVNHSHGVDYDLYDEHRSSAMSFAA